MRYKSIDDHLESEHPMNKLKPIQILIVDDEQGIRDMVRFLLEPMGYIIACAQNGAEALAMIEKHDYDIVFLDVHMPRMRGSEALDRILQVKPFQIVIIFSSSSDPYFVFESGAKQQGAFDCLYKPFELNDLLGVINRAEKKLGLIA